MKQELSESISIITKIKSGNQFHNYIDFIRFPFYRNLEINTKIQFDFPLTVFIGQNGCGKSSCLHALFGAPRNHTPYQFWFDTKVDPIEYYDDDKKRHSFWYSFKDNQNKTNEVIKARIKRGADPNYWETSRPLTWAGMKTRASGKRDKPINKNVVYIDFRAELSAFDKYFYFGNVKGIASKTKQEFIQKKSIQLKKVLSGEVEQYNTASGKVNKPIRNITNDELKWISFILGKTYESAVFLEHSFFRNDGYSVIFKTSHAQYSEAFAGSGEVAVVRLVMRILDAKDYSLILLDEPEVSLHPGAQTRLKIFLLDQIKRKKHQIILTSHSPSIVSELPKSAIKVFLQNPNTGRFKIIEDLTPEEAFYHIEYPIERRKGITVEDLLAKEILSEVLEKIGKAAANIFTVKFNPGGQSVIKKEFATMFCRENPSMEFIFFDGDQKPTIPHHDWREFSEKTLSTSFLKKITKEQTNEDIRFSVDGGDGGGDDTQQFQFLKNYLDYYLTNVFYLPKQIPEEIIWDNEFAHKMIDATMNNENLTSIRIKAITEATGAKTKFALIAKTLQGKDDAEAILSTQKLFIQNWLNKQNEDFIIIKEMLISLISRK